MSTLARPKAGSVETRTAPDLLTTEDRRIRGLVPYNVESRDLGGWTEIIEKGALDDANMDDLVVNVDHAGVPLGRYPTTLQLEDRDDGLHWSVTPPESRGDVREAVERGDLRAGSWRMRVAPGGDEWRGDVRHITRVAELRDVSVVTAPAYPAAAVEYRSAPEPDPAGADASAPVTPTAETRQETTMTPEDRQQATETATGGLQVEDRAVNHAQPRRGLADEFRQAGFPGETATISWEAYEQRAVTWTGSLDTMSRVGANSSPLGFDQRYAWPAFGRVGVEAGVTSVDVVQQTARTLPTAASMIRAVDATTNKPEVASTLAVVALALKQVAAIQSGVPNVYLESAAVNSIIESDLRLALNEGLDKLVLDAIAGSDFQAPGTDNILVSIRKAITTIAAAGYNADTVILTPAAAEAIDVMVTGSTGATADFIHGPGNYGPATIFGLNKRVSKTIPAVAVADSTALGKLYASPVTLARFEEAAGKTNSALVRLEGHAVFGVERQAAAVRIAAT